MDDEIIELEIGKDEIRHKELRSMICRIDGLHYRIYPYANKIVPVERVVIEEWREVDAHYTTDITPERTSQTQT